MPRRNGGALQRVKKANVIPREQSDRGNPYSKTLAFLTHFRNNHNNLRERIATPVCALARNDSSLTA